MSNRFVYHFIFAFKYRKTAQEDIAQYIKRNVPLWTARYKGTLIAYDLHENNHLHLLVELPAYMSPADFMRRFKGYSGHTVNKAFHRSGPLWQKRYLARTVGTGGTKQVSTYINRFKEKHNV